MSQPTIAPRTCHMAFRLNNAQPITAAYGQGMVTAAMDHFAASLQRYLVGLHGYLGPRPSSTTIITADITKASAM